MNVIKIAGLLSFLLVSACSVFPQYSKPEVKVASTWQAPLPHDGNMDALQNWWIQFNDKTLSQLIAAAQLDSPSLDIAVANIKAARANITTAQAQGLPSLTASASASRQKSGVITNSASAQSKIAGGLDASWEIDLFGGIEFSTQAAQARLQAKQTSWHDARVSLAAEVATDYVSYRACQMQVDSYQTALDSKKETARLTSILAKAGFSAPADADLSEASFSASESTLIAQKAQCDVTLKSLVALTNLDEHKLRDLLGTAHKIPQPQAFSVNTLPANLLMQRPDLVIAERNLAAASADIGVATANRYPTISLLGNIARTNLNPGSTTNSWSFGPSISLPIFDAGHRKAEVTKAQASYEIALATYQQGVRNAVKEVEQVLVNLDSANQRSSAELTSKQQYAKYYKAAEINWRAGGLSLLALEDARRQMITAEISYINQQQNQVQYWIALYKALGGGWQNMPAKETVELEQTKAN